MLQVLVAAVLMGGCDSGGSDGRDLLARAEEAVESAGTYRMTMTSEGVPLSWTGDGRVDLDAREWAFTQVIRGSDVTSQQFVKLGDTQWSEFPGEPWTVETVPNGEFGNFPVAELHSVVGQALGPAVAVEHLDPVRDADGVLLERVRFRFSGEAETADFTLGLGPDALPRYHIEDYDHGASVIMRYSDFGVPVTIERPEGAPTIPARSE